LQFVKTLLANAKRRKMRKEMTKMTLQHESEKGLE